MLEEDFKKEYEISFLLLKDGFDGEIEKAVMAEGGEVFYKKPAVSLRLAYPINKQPSAYFGFMYFRASPSAAEKIQRQLKLNPDILRFLIITPPMPVKEEKKKYAPSAPKIPPAVAEPALSNEALEKKLEEILK
jgi:ribosomal protein S6